MRKTRRAALAFGVGLIGLVEIGLRVAGFERPPPPFVVFHPVGEKVEADILARPEVATDGTLFWRLRPNQTISLGDGLPYRVNAAGFRGGEVVGPKPPGVRRIAAFGDSVTFGLGVPEEAVFIARIPEFLGEAGGRIEVANFGIPAYTTFQGRRLLEKVLSSLQPDAVVLTFGGANDFRPTVWTDRERARPRGGSARWIGRLRLVQAVGAFVSRLSATLEPLTVRVPLPDFEDDLGAMVALIRGAGAIPILVVPPVAPELARLFPLASDYQSAVRGVAARSNVSLADAAAAFDERPNPASLYIDLPHPTLEGHAILAEVVASAMRRAGF